MLKTEGKINGFIIDNMNTWKHSGFQVYCGNSVDPFDDVAIERLAQYIVRAPISQERMIYISQQESSDGIAQVVYEGKTSGTRETFSALDWLARLVTHIPNKGEQMVRYYGYYSNKSRGQRKKIEEIEDGRINNKDKSDSVPFILEPDLSKKAFRKNWARLIQKVYQIDPLKCPKCSGRMRIISFIEDEATIKKILVHLKLWLPQDHAPPDSDSFPLNFNGHRNFEWWEAMNNTAASCDTSDQMPYEDEYSQLIPCEY